MDFLLTEGTSYRDYGIEFAKQAGEGIQQYAKEELTGKVRQWCSPEDELPAHRNSVLVVPFILLAKAIFSLRDVATLVTNALYIALVLPLDAVLVGVHFLAVRLAGTPAESCGILPLHTTRDVLWSGAPISTGRGCRYITLPASLLTVDRSGAGRGHSVVRDNSQTRMRFGPSGVISTLASHVRRVPVLGWMFPKQENRKQEPELDFHQKMGHYNDALNSELTYRAVPIAVPKSNYSSW